MHTIQILWLITWPVSIIISYFAVVKVLSFYENRIEKDNDSGVTDNQ